MERLDPEYFTEGMGLSKGRPGGPDKFRPLEDYVLDCGLCSHGNRPHISGREYYTDYKSYCKIHKNQPPLKSVYGDY